MDGENNGKPYEQIDDLGGKKPLFLGWHPYTIVNPKSWRFGSGYVSFKLGDF